ncbi:hypothetical protein P43SY_010474 [Pythium insidiosum]|uniref:Transposase IS30-like HTH domain-containing protein n=1 Tax=Pythium insidiosum TaxID=114742 RepID=A0AAD5LZ29_PYTIN|nr:hypothetical protein P43SY_010474 [Pythium insidiosum]
MALTDEDRGRIKGLREAGKTVRAIALAVGCSPATVTRVVKGLFKMKKRGRKDALSARELRRLVRTASKGELSSAALKARLDLPLI